MASRPASTFDSNPPYTVRLFVDSPRDPQPGWLRILDLEKDDAGASAEGVFPEKNRIHVNTHNVSRIQLHIGLLPLAQGKRTILHIDEQGIEITPRGRKYIDLERTSTGVWETVKSPGPQ